MPEFSDIPKVIDIASATDKGITNLVRKIGISGRSSLFKFVADIETDLDFDCVIKFWNNDFEVSSGTTSFGVGERKVVLFEDWVFCGNEDFFYVTLEITDWKTNTDIELTLYSSMIVRGYDGLVLNAGGTLLYSEPVHDEGVMFDLVDNVPINNDQYNEYSDIMEKRSIQGHVIREKVEGEYARGFVDGDYRSYNMYGDSIQVLKFVCNNSINKESVQVSYDAMTNDLTCTTGLGVDVIGYAGPEIYKFEIVSGGDQQNIDVWVDLDNSIKAGYPGIDPVSTTVVKKYLKGSAIETAGLEVVSRTPALFSCYRAVNKSVFSEELNFSYNVGFNRWEATLTYAAVVDQNYSLLQGGGIPIPDNVWEFLDELTIYINNVDFDGSLVYVFEYAIDIHAIFEMNLADFSSVDEMYLLPFIDIFSKRASLVKEINFEEVVPFTTTGIGKLKFFSNGDSSDVIVKRIRRAIEETLPPSAILNFVEDMITIDGRYYSSDSSYIVSYIGLVANPQRVANEYVTFRYQKEDLSWSGWEYWDGRSLMPWKYFEATVKQVGKIQIRVDITASEDFVIVRNVGLVLVSLRAGELK